MATPCRASAFGITIIYYLWAQGIRIGYKGFIVWAQFSRGSVSRLNYRGVAINALEYNADWAEELKEA